MATITNLTNDYLSIPVSEYETRHKTVTLAPGQAKQIDESVMGLTAAQEAGMVEIVGGDDGGGGDDSAKVLLITLTNTPQASDVFSLVTPIEDIIEEWQKQETIPIIVMTYFYGGSVTYLGSWYPYASSPTNSSPILNANRTDTNFSSPVPFTEEEKIVISYDGSITINNNLVKGFYIAEYNQQRQFQGNVSELQKAYADKIPIFVKQNIPDGAVMFFATDIYPSTSGLPEITFKTVQTKKENNKNVLTVITHHIRTSDGTWTSSSVDIVSA